MKKKFLEEVKIRLNKQADMLMLIAFALKNEADRHELVEISMDIDVACKKIDTFLNKPVEVLNF